MRKITQMMLMVLVMLSISIIFPLKVTADSSEYSYEYRTSMIYLSDNDFIIVTIHNNNNDFGTVEVKIDGPSQTTLSITIPANGNADIPRTVNRGDYIISVKTSNEFLIPSVYIQKTNIIPPYITDPFVVYTPGDFATYKLLPTGKKARIW